MEPFAYESFEEYPREQEEAPSGFGWQGSWQVDGEVSSGAPEAVTPADDFWLRSDVSTRRVLQLSRGAAIRRQLLKTIRLDETCDFYISFVTQGAVRERKEYGDLRVALLPATSAAVDEKHRLSFGFSNSGEAYFVGDGVSLGRKSIPNNESRLCVMKFLKNGQCVMGLMRTFTRGESITAPPKTERMTWARDWTTMGEACSGQPAVSCIRISVGKDAEWRIADLRIGPTWESVTDAYRAGASTR